MALDQASVVARIREVLLEIPELKAVYAASESGINGIPAAFNDVPCAVVFPGPTQEYILSMGQHRHTYDVKVHVIESGGDLAERVVAVLPFVDRVIEKLVTNVTLGGRANSVLFKSDSGLTGLEYGGVVYTGYEIILEVSEQAPASPAAGS